MAGPNKLDIGSVMDYCEIYDLDVGVFERILALESEYYPMLLKRLQGEQDGRNKDKS